MTLPCIYKAHHLVNEHSRNDSAQPSISTMTMIDGVYDNVAWQEVVDHKSDYKSISLFLGTTLKPPQFLHIILCSSACP